MNLYDLIGNLQNIGFYDILLPWALFFAMCYGLLIKVGPFSGKDQKSITSIISMAVAFFAVAYTPYGMQFGVYLAELFGKSGTILAGLLVLVLFLGMAGIKTDDNDIKKYKNKIAIALVAIAAIIYLGTGNLLAGLNIPGINEESAATLLMIAVVIGGVIWLTRK